MMDSSPFVKFGNFDPETLITGGIVLFSTSILGGVAILQTYCEHKHVNLLREASVAILIGMLVGLITYIPAIEQHTFDNSSKIFFFILLPIIVFKEGYGLNKQHFMKNFFYVILYGIFGSIFYFIILAGLNYSLTNSDIFWIKPNSTTQQNSTYAQMFFAACTTSKDSAVSLSVLEFEHAPKLHSIIFGEQILNDVIVFALSKTVEKFNDDPYFVSGEWYNAFKFIGQILEQLAVGLLLGVIVGSFATWITKKSRFLSEHSSIVTAFTIYISYFSFCLCEAFGYCGVLAVLICGIMLSHYQTYNLPKISSTSSKITVKAIAYVSETVIYFYIGFAVTATEIKDNYNEDPDLQYQIYTYILIQYFVFSPVAKLLSMLLAHGLAVVLRLKTKGPWRINKYEFFILFYSGLIKGVVAYALICEQEVGGKDYYKIIQTTSLYMVVVTTLVNGGTLKYVCEWAYKKMEDENIVQSRQVSQVSQNIRQTFIQEDQKDYIKLKHKSEKFFKKFDENYIKPLLIFNYVERKNDIISAKKLEKHKLKYEKEQDQKMYDDSVRQQRELFELHKQKKQNLTKLEYDDVKDGSSSEDEDQKNNHHNDHDHHDSKQQSGGELTEIIKSIKQNGNSGHH